MNRRYWLVDKLMQRNYISYNTIIRDPDMNEEDMQKRLDSPTNLLGICSQIYSRQKCERVHVLDAKL